LVALDQTIPEIGLGREMIVQRCFRDMQRGGDVGIAEGVEAARLHQTFGNVEDAGRRFRDGGKRSHEFPID
jgi:hypothetical protein